LGFSLVLNGFGSVELKKLSEIKHGKFVYSGFEIAVYSEIRDIQNKMVKAGLVNPHKIVVQIPYFNTQFHTDYNAAMPRGNAFDYYQPEEVNAHVKFRNNLASNPSINFRMIFLNFPNSVALSDAIFSPKAKFDGYMQMKSVALSSTVQFMNKSFHTTTLRNSWQVHVLDDDPEQVEASDDNDENLNRVAMMLGGTTVHDVPMHVPSTGNSS
jgi:hypothetical protein